MAEIVDFGLQKHKLKMDARYFDNGLSVVAGDTGRRIEVQLLDTNGMVQNTTGLNLRLNAIVEGKATYTDAALVDAKTGKYQLDLSNGMFLAPGDWQFQWQITDSAGKKLHSFVFTGSVGKNISEGGSQATNFYLNAEELRLKTIELQTDFDKLGDQFEILIDETTGKDVISAPEIIAARNGEASLNARLTKNEQETTAQLKQMAYIPKVKTGVDNGSIIQQLYDSIPSGGTLKIPAGIHEFSTPLLFNRKVNIDAVGSRLLYTGTVSGTTAVQIGSEGEDISQIEVRGLDVENKTTDWLTNKTGIKVVNIYNSNIGLSFWNFHKGLVIEGINGIGNSYNKYFITIAYNNKKSITITSKDGGWANENIFYGGRFGWSSNQTTDDENVHVTIEYIDYSNNHNKFYGPSFEKASTGTGYAWKIEKGRYNYFRDCRYEGLKKIFIGEGSLYNEITSGYDSTALEIEDKGTGTFIQTPQRISYSLEGPMKLMNRAGVNSNVLEVLSPINKAESFSVKGSGKLESSGLGTFVAGIRWYARNSAERGIYHGGGTVASTAANPGSIYADIRGGYDGLFYKVTGTNSTSGWKNIEVNNFGNSNQRPATPYPGQLYKDATIKKLIWWDGINWLDVMGNIV